MAFILTQETIRIFLQDMPEVNRLLGKEEFGAIQIKNAINLTLSAFNSIPPFIDFITVINETLPSSDEDIPPDEGNIPTEYQYPLFLGVLYHLLNGKALEYFRNTLQYQTGGVSVDDKSMANPYMQIAAGYKDQFESSVKAAKIATNSKNAFGHVGSEYAMTYYFYNIDN